MTRVSGICSPLHPKRDANAEEYSAKNVGIKRRAGLWNPEEGNEISWEHEQEHTQQ